MAYDPDNSNPIRDALIADGLGVPFAAVKKGDQSVRVLEVTVSSDPDAYMQVGDDALLTAQRDVATPRGHG